VISSINFIEHKPNPLDPSTMKHRMIPVKRHARSRGMFRRLSAAITKRKHRVAAGARPVDFDDEESDVRIGRAWMIIISIHLFAFGLVFAHHKFLKQRPSAPVAVTVPAQPVAAAPTQDVRGTYIIKEGDTYTSVAAAHQVDELDLRAINQNAAVRKGLFLKIPSARPIAKEQSVTSAAATAPAVTVTATDASPAPHSVLRTEDGLVAAVDAKGAPKTKAAVAAPAKPSAPIKGTTYVVKPGDSIWRIANAHKVDQQELMKANGFDDPRKLKSGMMLVIPKAP
jgi:LysM repeat protein